LQAGTGAVAQERVTFNSIRPVGWDLDGCHSGTLVRLSNPPNILLRGIVMGADFSADGERIAFAQKVFRGPVSGRGAVWEVNRDGGELIEITASLEGDAGMPHYGEGGESIVFAAKAGEARDIYLWRRESGKIINLTQHPARENVPALSEDGTKLAFISDREGWREEETGERSFDVYVADIIEGERLENIRRITQFAGRRVDHPHLRQTRDTGRTAPRAGGRLRSAARWRNLCVPLLNRRYSAAHS
jgi:Tol biopolymer transport system component